MTVAVTNNMTLVNSAEVTGDWYTSTGKINAYSGFNREGTYCMGMSVNNTEEYCYDTISSTDMNNKIIYSWQFCAGNVDTQANGGFQIVIGDGTNIRGYYVGGRDNFGFVVTANQNWSCFILDTSKLSSYSYTQHAGSSAPTLSAVTQIGCGCTTTSKALGGADNFFWDVIRYTANDGSPALTITGGSSGDPGTFQEIADDDASTSSGKAYGIIREIASGVFEVQGAIQIGDDSGTNSVYFADTNSTIVFADATINNNHFKLKVVGNSTGTTYFKLGTKVGSGDTAVGSNGCTFQAPSGITVGLFDFSDADIGASSSEGVYIYGTKFFQLDSGIKLSSDATYGISHEFIGNTVDSCGQADVGRVIVRNCNFSATTATDAAILWNENINIKNSNFNANTTGAGIEHPSATGSPYTHDGLKYSGNTYDVYNSSGSSITINNTNGSNGSTYTGSTVTFQTAITLKITVQDEDTNPIQNAQVAIYKTSDRTELMNKDTDVNGEASTSYSGGATDIEVRVRKSSTGDTKYIPFSTLGTTGTTDFEFLVTLQEDTNA